jgi:hypothetical protein
MLIMICKRLILTFDKGLSKSIFLYIDLLKELVKNEGKLLIH